LFAVPDRVGAGKSASTWAANGVMALAGITPSRYNTPVSGFRIGRPRTPWRCSMVGMLAKVTVRETWRKPS
jgi:hypothetical protein